jgi:hypothetical protein
VRGPFGQAEGEGGQRPHGPAGAKGGWLGQQPKPRNEKRINVFLFLFMNKFVNSFSRDFELNFEFCKNHSTHMQQHECNNM